MQGLSELYLPDKLSRASQLYGAIGTTVVTLGWFFFLGRSIALSTEINAVMFERLGSVSSRVFPYRFFGPFLADRRGYVPFLILTKSPEKAFGLT